MKDEIEQRQKHLKKMKERINHLEEANQRLKQSDINQKYTEKDFLLQKSYWKQLFDNNPVAIVKLDTKNRIIDVNKSFKTIFQYSIEEVRGKKLPELVVPKSMLSEGHFFFSQGLQGKIYEKESVRRRKDGSLVNVLISSLPIFLGKKIIGVYAIYIDITKLKKAEEALQKTEALESSILRAVPHALVGLRERRIIFANESAESVFGWKAKELIGKTTRILYRSDEEFEQIGKDFYPKLKRRRTYREEFLCRHKNGRDILCMITASRIGSTLKDEQIVVTYEDITKQRQIAEASKESHQKFSSLFYNFPEALAYLDKNSRIIDVNPRFTELFGYSLEEIKGRDINDGMIHPDNRIEEGKNLDKSALNKGYFNYETVRKKKNGTLFPVFISGALVTIKGRKKGLIGVYTDITGRKKEERVKNAIYKISEAAHSTKNLAELYRLVHKTISELMPAYNFYIALYDKSIKKLSFQYWVDEHNPKPLPRELKKGITEYVFNTGKSLIGAPQVIKKLQKEGKIKIHGTLPICWLGVPLKVHNKTIGVMAVQSYTKGITYGEGEESILRFVSMQAAMAIERKRAENALILQKSYLQTLFEGSPMAIAMLDNDSRIIQLNKGFQRLFKYSIAEVKGHSIDDIIVPRELKERAKRLLFRASHGEVIERESIRRRKDGSLFDASVIAYPITVEDKVSGIYAIYTDITERKKSEQQLTYLATHDSLTNLPNRALFSNRFKLERELTERNHQKFALLLLDLDNFKDINDTLGHKAGDELLVKVAGRFTNLLRKSDVVARFGGDEFIFLLPEISQAENVRKVARKILNIFKEPFIIGKHSVHITLSIGGVIYPDDGVDADTLIKKADTAMYYVKARGRSNYKHYTSGLDKNS